MLKPKKKVKAGYLYILTHPSDPTLVKVGVTILKPEKRLAQHNSNYKKYAGQIVKETGQKWELKTYIEVPDPYCAEAAFWGATPLADIPSRGGVEIYKMEWAWVLAGLEAAQKAGVRPSPEQLPDHPDWVYAYTAWMRKRLQGRDITLVGYVTSRSGKSAFRCANNHEWRTRSAYVAEGEGCPECGIGNRKPEEIWQMAKLGHICLLINPDKPGFVKIGLTYNKLENLYEGNDWENWEVHRYRFVEDPVLAEILIWELLGQPKPINCEPIKIDLSIAEEAFRKLIYKMYSEIALAEKGIR